MCLRLQIALYTEDFCAYFENKSGSIELFENKIYNSSGS